ncbi:MULTISPECIES: DUF2157 domain-containing protein [Providencia]|uniref:DUF2157 domain-containing protein n=1 Tax=Providencia vermicola TaxID=333965 RepID=A0AAX3RXJ5_9GAMM|nr:MULTISPECIES: DUF2157 domain-containing protein [Providencia]ELX8377858.1 DUF2157 domain-containing protein [Providencia stuartii]EMD5257399.1 DUF2157 domain-containing protein [Providencia stuartii]USB37372.1 DUF2157 domain-containing protein [Providencia vermicola]WFC06304.1 DUF2157 domain-containing protein [Providencia vermicola]
MGKFANIKNNTDNLHITQNNVGNNNTQNTQVINNTIHNNNTSRKNDEQSSAIAFISCAFLGIAFLVWAFFSYHDEVHIILNYSSIALPLLSILALLILFIKKENETPDIVRCILLLTIGATSYCLTNYINTCIPLNLLEHAKKATSATNFWKELTPYGKELAISIITSSILLMLSIVLGHLSSLRELSYALANKNRIGLWFYVYKLTNIFKLKAFGTGGIILTLTILSGLVISGYIIKLIK